MTINAIDKSVTIHPSYDGKLYSRYPMGDLSGFLMSLVASAWDQSGSSTLVGPAPLGVFFNATGTSFSGVDNFIEVGYHWDAGYTTTADAGAFSYGSSPNKGNYQGGPVWGHVYRTPGRYTATVRSADPTRTADASIVIIVQDPQSIYAASATILYSTDGSDDQVTYPGAIPRTWSGTATVVSNTRYLFKGGQSFTGSLIVPVINGSLSMTPVSNVHIATWGAGRPSFPASQGIRIAAGLSTASDNLHPGFPYNISVQGLSAQVEVVAFASFLTVVDNNMKGKSVPNFGSTGDDTFGSLDNAGSPAGQVWYNPRDLHWVENQHSATANSAAQTFFVYGKNINMQGNYIGECKEHGCRVKGAVNMIFRNNYVTGWNDPTFSGKSLITVRAQQLCDGTVGSAVAAWSGAWYPTRVVGGTAEQHGDISTRYVVVDDNILGATDWSADNEYAGGPEFFNASVLFNIQDVVYQRNKHYPGPVARAANRRPLHAWGASRVTFRENDYYSLSSSVRSNPRIAVRQVPGTSDNSGQTSEDYAPVYIYTSTDGTATDLGVGIFEAPALILPRKFGS